ncbi:unnamed protein product, partial [Urochloa humidicola]
SHSLPAFPIRPFPKSNGTLAAPFRPPGPHRRHGDAAMAGGRAHRGGLPPLPLRRPRAALPRLTRLQAVAPPRLRPVLPAQVPRVPSISPDAGHPLPHTHTLGARVTHVRFYRTSPSCPPIRDRRDWDALDSRHGRVLLMDHAGMWLAKLVVWDPITEEEQEVAPLPRHARRAHSASVAVLCAGAAGGGSCDHLDCHRNPFLVVFVGIDSEGMFSCVYSSEDGIWRSGPTVAAQQPRDCVEMSSSAFAGNALYFVFVMGTKILKYDLSTRELSVIHLPPGSDGVYGELVLMTMEDNNRLGFARREGYTLNLWSLEADPNGAMRWTPSRVIEHETLLPVDALSIPPYVVAFAEGMIFMKTCDGLFSIDLKSCRSKKVLCEDYGVQKVFPYRSFYAPGESGVFCPR